MSSICSASNCRLYREEGLTVRKRNVFNLAFSSSSAFNRLASDTVIPEYFAFQA